MVRELVEDVMPEVQAHANSVARERA
jgi:hypothetical protein